MSDGHIIEASDDSGTEKRLVFVTDPRSLEYVRESRLLTKFGTGRPRPDDIWPTAHVVGWADLRSGANRKYGRRVFWIAAHDRLPGASSEIYPSGAPAEAVDPRRLAPNRPSGKDHALWGPPSRPHARGAA